MTVFFTEKAEQDLEDIVDYIAQDNPVRAISFTRELIDRCEKLADAPRAFPLIQRYENSGVRRRSYRGYLIFYSLSEDDIYILHILNGAQDYEAILFPQGD